MKATFDSGVGTYHIAGSEVDAVTVRGAADAVSKDAAANIRVLADRLQRAEIDAQEFYDGMKRETKMLHMAEFALANGGIDNVTDWSRVEQIIAAQWNGVEGSFPGLRAFAEDIQNGRYGTDILSTGVANRAGMYADIGRATFENETMAFRAEKLGHEYAMRVIGAADHCVDCVDWAALGAIPIEEMMSDYAIGASVCGARCYCAIVTGSLEELQ